MQKQRNDSFGLSSSSRVYTQNPRPSHMHIQALLANIVEFALQRSLLGPTHGQHWRRLEGWIARKLAMWTPTAGGHTCTALSLFSPCPSLSSPCDPIPGRVAMRELVFSVVPTKSTLASIQYNHQLRMKRGTRLLWA